MNRNEIIEYVMHTPGNTNKTILEQMLKNLSPEGDNETGGGVVAQPESLYTGYYQSKLTFLAGEGTGYEYEYNLYKISDIILTEEQLKRIRITTSGTSVAPNYDTGNAMYTEQTYEFSFPNGTVERISDYQFGLQDMATMVGPVFYFVVVTDYENQWRSSPPPGLYMADYNTMLTFKAITLQEKGVKFSVDFVD